MTRRVLLCARVYNVPCFLRMQFFVFRLLHPSKNVNKQNTHWLYATTCTHISSEVMCVRIAGTEAQSWNRSAPARGRRKQTEFNYCKWKQANSAKKVNKKKKKQQRTRSETGDGCRRNNNNRSAFFHSRIVSSSFFLRLHINKALICPKKQSECIIHLHSGNRKGIRFWKIETKRNASDETLKLNDTLYSFVPTKWNDQMRRKI